MTPAELTELDRMMATRVMSWREYIWSDGYGGCPAWQDSKGRHMGFVNPHDHPNPWTPTTNIVQAMRVAEKIGEGFMLVKDRSGQGYFCTYSSQGLMGCGVVETPALAICLAAKAWLEARENAKS